MPGGGLHLPGRAAFISAGKSWGTSPNPLKRMAFRATLRDPDGFGHIGWMIRSFGVFGAVARVPPPGSLNDVFSWGSGE